jgi:hypothetical protein
MAKSEHGLPARSGATQMQISRAEYDLKWAYAEGRMSFDEYSRKLKALRKREKREKGRCERDG